MTHMWLINPRLLCKQHLLGEHAELHQELGSIRSGKINTVRGHAAHGQLDTSKLESRHDDLAEELERRGMNHNSPLTFNSFNIGTVDPDESRRDLAERCPDCRKNMEAITA